MVAPGDPRVLADAGLFLADDLGDEDAAQAAVLLEPHWALDSEERCISESQINFEGGVNITVIVIFQWNQV